MLFRSQLPRTETSSQSRRRGHGLAALRQTHIRLVDDSSSDRGELPASLDATVAFARSDEGEQRRATRTSSLAQSIDGGPLWCQTDGAFGIGRCADESDRRFDLVEEPGRKERTNRESGWRAPVLGNSKCEPQTERADHGNITEPSFDAFELDAVGRSKVACGPDNDSHRPTTAERCHDGIAGNQGRIERDDPRIDASSKLPDGTPIDGASGLKRALRAEQDAFLKCLTQKMLTYALGRELTLADQPTVKSIVEQTKQQGSTLNRLIEAIEIGRAHV